MITSHGITHDIYPGTPLAENDNACLARRTVLLNQLDGTAATTTINDPVPPLYFWQARRCYRLSLQRSDLGLHIYDEITFWRIEEC